MLVRQQIRVAFLSRVRQVALKRLFVNMNGKAPCVPSLRHEEKTKLPVVALSVIFKMHKRAMIAMPQRQVMKLHVKARVWQL